jgi:hypothetical protein
MSRRRFGELGRPIVLNMPVSKPSGAVFCVRSGKKPPSRSGILVLFPPFLGSFLHNEPNSVFL